MNFTECYWEDWTVHTKYCPYTVQYAAEKIEQWIQSSVFTVYSREDWTVNAIYCHYNILQRRLNSEWTLGAALRARLILYALNPFSRGRECQQFVPYINPDLHTYTSRVDCNTWMCSWGRRRRKGVLLALGRVELRPMGNDGGLGSGDWCHLVKLVVDRGVFTEDLRRDLDTQGSKAAWAHGYVLDLYCQNCVHQVCKPREMEAVLHIETCVYIAGSWEMEPW